MQSIFINLKKQKLHMYVYVFAELNIYSTFF